MPKTLLVEHGAPTAADKRRIQEGIHELHWLATLKPTTIGVPALREDVREYLEINVRRVALRAGARTARLAGLIHRAVPYPVFLLVAEETVLTLSLAHKRWSQGAAGTTVLDGKPKDRRDRFRGCGALSLIVGSRRADRRALDHTCLLPDGGIARGPAPERAPSVRCRSSLHPARTPARRNQDQPLRSRSSLLI
ncbi:MAG: DUF4391 domain-containing protein [Candidatus Accumulibacter sp.]|nr:DUF4391 domain-containing protein [Accumulibacter sp.]